MSLSFNTSSVEHYTNKSQIARVLTEEWVLKNGYCPNCGSGLQKHTNNKPVADFYCFSCKEDFELKSKSGKLGTRIVDGAYHTMINRITSDSNPNFLFLTYNTASLTVNNFLIIPKHFFTPDIIEKRKPLSPTAKRAGWIGCNISLSNIPTVGTIFFVRESISLQKEKVLDNWRNTLFLRQNSIESKGWTLDVLHCIDQIPLQEFTLADVYMFEQELQTKHPTNRFVRDKIRQQLQILRDRGLITFRSKGVYSKRYLA